MWLRPIDKLIDHITMYRLLLYYLLGLIIVAVVLSVSGVMHYSAVDIVISAAVLVFACWLINKILASIFYAPVNPESSILTGLILALIIQPKPTGFNLLFMLAAAGLAMGSKYILTYKRKHIFNPAAVAVFLTAIGPHQTADWWVGTAAMLPFVIAGGLLLVRKIRRESMVLTYLIATVITTALFALAAHSNPLSDLKDMVLTSAAFFLGFVMLTEPYTSPDTKTKRLVYGALVGVLIAPLFHIGHYYTTPEAALVIGNLFAFFISNKTKLFPVLRRKYVIAKNSAEFVFATDAQIAYQPGQYMEFTLPHERTDSRGSRRYFSLASSPTEPDIKIGVRFYKEGSSYKSALSNMDPGDYITASQLSGDFVLPDDKKTKLVFIAGGIGITPFRSMLKFLIDKHETRDITLLYAASSPEDIAYRETIDAARDKLGVKTYYIFSRKRAVKSPHELNGRINQALIERLVPDYLERTFYISGPFTMIEDIKGTLVKLGVSRANIKIDFFSGYA